MDIHFKHLMILVPHQDDEILMAAGVIRRTLQQDGKVDVVMVTNGDCGCSDFSKGRKRLQESLSGLELLGLSKDCFHILGYADTGMMPEDSFLTKLYEEKDDDRPYSSHCSGCTYSLPEKPEFHMEKYGEHAPYCRKSFRQDLKEMIDGKRPDAILTTSLWDIHGDHSGLYRFVREVLEELEGEAGYRPQLYTGLVHSTAGDENWPLPGTAVFDCPRGLEKDTTLQWKKRIAVPVPEEMLLEKGSENLKLRALLQHETALEPGAYNFLMSFVKEEEIFWRIS